MSSFRFFLLTICTILLVFYSIPTVSLAKTSSKTPISSASTASKKSKNEPPIRNDDEYDGADENENDDEDDDDPDDNQVDFEESVTVRKDIAQQHVAAFAAKQTQGWATSIYLNTLVQIGTILVFLLLIDVF